MLTRLRFSPYSPPQALILGAAQSLARASDGGDARWFRRTVLLPAAMLAPLVVLDPLSAAVLAAAALLLQLVTALTTALEEHKATAVARPSPAGTLASLVVHRLVCTLHTLGAFAHIHS